MRCIDIYCKNDTSISMKSSRQNYSKWPYLLIGEEILENEERNFNVSLLQFDLSSLDKRSEVKKAELSIYLNYDDLYNFDFNLYLEAYILLNPYTFSEVCWRNAPNIKGVGCGTNISINDCNNYVKLDITAIVKYWINSEYQNYGIALGLKGAKNIMSFNSSRYSKGPFMHLEFDYYKAEEVTNENLSVITIFQGENHKKVCTEKRAITNGFSTLESAHFDTKPDLKLYTLDLFPLRDVSIKGKDISYDNESMEIILAPNHSYIVLGSVSIIPAKDKYDVGMVLIFNDEVINGGIIRNTTSKKSDKGITLSLSIGINTVKGKNILKVQYNTNTGLGDIISNSTLWILKVN